MPIICVILTIPPLRDLPRIERETLGINDP